MNILIVEDDRVNQLILASLLHKAGYTNLLMAASAQEAFTQLGMDDPARTGTAIDLILMDILLPGMDGLEACRRIKADDRFRDLPIIIVTSLTEVSNLESAYAAGAMDYLTKPFNKIELLVRLRSALTLKREMDCRKSREKELLQVMQQLEAANRQLQRLSYLDGLTGIANRRHFDALLDQEWKRAARESLPLSLILIDVDWFKKYNDTYGHQSGDDCLKQVAETLSGTLRRPGDLVARYGGEEFVVILANTAAAGAVEVAETLRARVESLAIVNEQAPPLNRVTISLGLAVTAPAPLFAPETLVAAADRALYQAKLKGRNRVEMIEVMDCASLSSS